MSKNITSKALASSVSVNNEQYVGQGSQTGGTFAYGASNTVLTYDVRDEKLEKFILDMLGSASKNNQVVNGLSGCFGLTRVLPQVHPQLAFMHASRILSMEGLAPYSHSGGGSPGGITNGRAIFKRWRVAVQFETLPYLVSSDAVSEDRRFTTVDVDPAAEFIERQQGSFSANGTPIPGSNGVSQIVSKVRYNFRWYQVPDIGLFSGGFEGGGRSKHIEEGFGTVNESEWRGYPRGTLLLEGWKPTQRTNPELDKVTGAARYWDVEIKILYFNPQPAADPNVLGHNLVPLPDGKWYIAYITEGGSAATGPYRYAYYDFNKLFTMN